MLYSGIDLHKRTSSITTLDGEGKIVDQIRLPNDKSVFLNYFLSHGREHKAVVESTANWYWLSDLLQEHGIDLTLAHAKYLKAISYAKVKTDKVDSLILAQLLRTGLIPQAHQIDPDKRNIRDLMRSRLHLTEKKVSSVNSIHRILEKFNLSIPGGMKLTSPSNLDCLNELPLSIEYQVQISFLSDQVRLFHKQIKDIERWVQDILTPHEDAKRLYSIPGVGKITAYTIYLEVDGIERFKSEKSFFSYCRLVPGAANSGGRNRHKSGNKDGNRYLKIAFTDAAIRATQYYAEIREFYKKKSRKTHKVIARTIVAKELARIAYHLLQDGVEFSTFKGVEIKRRKKNQWPRPASPDCVTGSVKVRRW